MKKLYKLLIIFPLLFGCVSQNKNEPIDYEVGVILTSEKTRTSFVSYYDSHLNEVRNDKVNYAALGTHFFQPIYDNGDMYLIPRGLMKEHHDKKVARIDLETGSIRDYDVDRINIINIATNTDYIYTTSNLNGVDYLTQTDKNNHFVKDISDKNFMMDLVVCIKDRVCLFQSRTENEVIESKIDIYDVDLNLLKSIDISDVGESQCKYIVKDNLLFFSNSLLNDQANNTISVFNIDDYSIKTIALKEDYPSDMQIYDNHLYVAHSFEVNLKGTKISVINLDDYTDIKEYDMGLKIMRMELINDYLYILDNDNYTEAIVAQYSLKDNLKKIKSKTFSVKDNFYPTVLFVKNNGSLKKDEQ